MTEKIEAMNLTGLNIHVLFKFEFERSSCNLY
jgi:hypothetical protein